MRNKIAGGFGGAISPPNGVRGGAPENFGFVSSKWPILGPLDDFSTMVVLHYHFSIKLPFHYHFVKNNDDCGSQTTRMKLRVPQPNVFSLFIILRGIYHKYTIWPSNNELVFSRLLSKDMDFLS